MNKTSCRHIFRRFFLAVLPFLALLMPSVSNGQKVEGDIDTSFYMAIDAANYDSLLNNFYMQQFRRSATRHQNRRASMMYADFDNIPDSVFVNRLQSLHTVVPLTYNSEVRAFIKVYVRIMSHRLDAMLSLSEYYFPMFEETLDRFKVPEELKYLTIVESALNPQATSRAGAAGLWQFMYATGKHYDLEISSLVDERRDPYKSTVAAARYLRSLYDMYGDWQMAMAAYNCGPGNVNKAIARSGGKHTFWEIYPYLPRETRGYIPKYIGATYIMNYYHEHGLVAGRYEIPVRTDTVHLHRDVHLGVVEKFTGISREQLRQLNPQFRTDVIPASSHSYALSLPTSKTSVFLQMEDTICKESKDTISKNAVIALSSSNVIYHRVKKGETFNSIAKKYGVSVSSLRRWNGKSRNSTLKVGTKLKIYLPAKDVNLQADAKSENANDSVSVADSNAVAGDSSAVAVPASKPASKPAAKKSEPVYYTVKKGDNLSLVAKRHGTTAQKLRQLNGLKSDVIRIGQRLRVK
ncbi:MAG: LysM peptidoglycan-binding domain-containing protein [Bacteroidales bacterium]|nr:LysM peptidoglycan-binding domain-containing protein [Bacteroidales bacterium]